MTTCVRYLDMKGKPVTGKVIPNNKGRQELTDQNGIARYDPDLPADVVFYPLGFATATIIPCVPPTAGVLPDELGRVGFCVISQYPCLMGTCYKVVHDDGSEIAHGYSAYYKAENIAKSSEHCKQAPAPATIPVTQADIISLRVEMHENIASLRNETQADLNTVAATATAQIEHVGARLLNMFANTASNVFAAATQYADNLFAGVSVMISEMKTDIETNFIAPLTSAVQALWDDIGQMWTTIEEIIEAAEQEVTARVKAISELDKSIRAWIESSIIDILIRALDREVDGGKIK